jgi:hypothetical protein
MSLSFFRGGDAPVTIREVARALQLGQVDAEPLRRMALAGLNDQILTESTRLENEVEIQCMSDTELFLNIVAEVHSDEQFSELFKKACDEMETGQGLTDPDGEVQCERCGHSHFCSKGKANENGA